MMWVFFGKLFANEGKWNSFTSFYVRIASFSSSDRERSDGGKCREYFDPTRYSFVSNRRERDLMIERGPRAEMQKQPRRRLKKGNTGVRIRKI